MYGKYFAHTFTGSMVGAGLNVFAVWSYVIANCDRTGHVELNPRYLASIMGADDEDIIKALEYLTSPDPNSRSKEHEGRRLIKEGQFLYFAPQYAKYRQLQNDEDRRDYMRDYMAQRRAAERADPDTPDVWDLDHILEAASHPTVAMGKVQAEEYFHWRNKTGWLDGKGRPVARTSSSLRSDMIRYKVDSPGWKDKEKARERGMSLGTGGL